jgi:DNA helicase-2/ATP-dependent DNA helicase PcrA
MEAQARPDGRGAGAESTGVTGADRLLADLDASQREAVTTDAAPLAILAGPGSGKTRVLTHRIAWRTRTGRLDPAHVLAVTFTRKAAGELRERLRSHGVADAVTAGTIHAIALAQLRGRAHGRGRDLPALLERKARLLVPMIGVRGSAAVLAASEIAGEIEWAKARLVGPDAYEGAVTLARRDPPRPAGEVATLYARYEREKRKRGLVDFDDLLLQCADALETDAEFAAAQRWRFRHLFVDEFQDVSPAQLRLLRGWLGDRDDLCVVGDPDQAIYAFAGADPSFLADFGRRFRGGHVVRLECNYRSTPQIVAAAEALLADAGRPRPRRRATREPGPAPEVACHDSDEGEATAVARGLRRLHNEGARWTELAVLYRTNAQSAVFEEALTAAGIPFRVRGDARFLDRPEVRAALDALRRHAQGDGSRSIAEHLAELTHGSGSEERSQHIDALVRLGREYVELEAAPGSVDGFLAYLATALRGEQPTDGDGVELLTFHRAKGLEFHSVFVTGLERGYVPIAHADTPAERAEERRLLYVALTRAECALHLSYASQRVLGGRSVTRTVSPWVDVIAGTPPSAVPPARPTPDRRTRLREVRDELARVKPSEATTLAEADTVLFAELVEWRRNLARAAGVPAFVIFHDTTLRGIATVRPETADALLALPGIGPVKAERHGDAVLDLVRRHAS